jgi:hypothetical protein
MKHQDFVGIMSRIASFVIIILLGDFINILFKDKCKILVLISYLSYGNFLRINRADPGHNFVETCSVYGRRRI